MDSNHLHRLRGLPAASISGTIGTVHPFHKAEDDQAASGGSLFGTYLMRASIAGIPELLYGSAAVTAANEWTEKWRIALPLSLPGLATLAVLSFVGTWNSYVCPQVVIQDRAKQLISFGLWQLSRSIGGALSTAPDNDCAPRCPLFAVYAIGSIPLVILFFALGNFCVEGLVESGLEM